MTEKKDQTMATGAANASPDRVPNMAAMAGRLGLTTVPAAWPTGGSQLARAIDACQRCDAGEVCTDWLDRVPKVITSAPAFCPNGPRFEQAKKAKKP